jgi:hypothetical protein
VINSKDTKEDVNLIGQTADVFIEYYNDNIPATFPHATHKALNAFQKQYPSLFEEDRKWNINKHRKKFMDWLVSHKDS